MKAEGSGMKGKRGPSAFFSDFFPTSVGDGISPFVELDVVDESLSGFTGETAVPDALGEDVAAFVAPAGLGDETAPGVAFFNGARGCRGRAPRSAPTHRPVGEVRLLISQAMSFPPDRP